MMNDKIIQNWSCANSIFLWKHYQLTSQQNLVLRKEHGVGTAAILDFFPTVDRALTTPL